MFRKTFISLVVLIFILVLGLNISVHGSSLEQTGGTPTPTGSLAGIRIYLGTTNNEVSLFDRNDTGASRLAAMLLREGVELLVLNWDAPIPDDIDLVILLAPASDYSGAQVAKLWTYVNNGGKLVLFAEPARGLGPNSALMELIWNAFGIRMEPGVLVDAAYLSPSNIRTPNALVTGLIVPADSTHPILDGIEVGRLALNGACPLRTESVILNINVTPLLMTGLPYYSETNPQVVQLNIGSDIAPGLQLVIATSVNNQTGARIAVLCDSDLVTNSYGFMTSPPGSDRFVFSNNVSLVFNTIYWALGLESQKPQLTFSPPAPTPTPTMTPTPIPTATPTVVG